MSHYMSLESHRIGSLDEIIHKWNVIVNIVLWGRITYEAEDLLLETVDAYHWSSGHRRGMGSPGCESFQPGRTLGYLWVLYFRHRGRLWGTKHERRGCVEVPSFGHCGWNLMGRGELLRYESFIPWILYRWRRPFVRSTCFRRRPVLIKGQGTIYHLLMDTLGGPLQM